MTEKYTTVCIGGAADGRRVTSDQPRLAFPVPKPVSLSPVFDDPIRAECRADYYHLERITFNDGEPPACILLYDEIRLREAFYLMTEAYAGRHLPKHSERDSRIEKSLQARITNLEDRVRQLKNEIFRLQARMYP